MKTRSTPQRSHKTLTSAGKKGATVAPPRRQLPPHLARFAALAPRYAGFTIIGLSVVGAWLFTPIPVAIGITILAVLRLWILRREERQAQTNI
jgi:hypothetical protein